mgnify:CR=1 FL=1
MAGVVWRTEHGRVVTNEARPQLRDLDDLPWPDREAIDIDRYVDVWRTHHGMGSVNLITARGCPYKCNWCSHAVFGYSHRRRSPGLAEESAAEQLVLRQLVSQHLDRAVLAQLGVLRLVDRPHSALPKETNDAIGADTAAVSQLRHMSMSPERSSLQSLCREHDARGSKLQAMRICRILCGRLGCGTAALPTLRTLGDIPLNAS